MNKRIILLGIFAVIAIAAVIWLSPTEQTETTQLAVNEVEEKVNQTTEKTDTKSVPTNPEFKIGDFFYGVGTRFNGITKDELLAARSFSDFIGDEHDQRIVSYSALNVIVLEDSEKTDLRVDGKGGAFSQAQLDFIKTLDYSTNLLIWAEYSEDSPWSGKIEESHWTPYLTITAATLPEYQGGKEALLNYLKTNSAEAVQSIKGKQLAPGKIYFTVTKEGDITNVKLSSTSNFKDVDQLLVELLKNAPGKWTPAHDSQGNAVAQELVFSFANLGC